jgi:two-component system CheB/CheR fusion protein
MGICLAPLEALRDRQMRILVVDDNEDFGELLVDVFTRWGHQAASVVTVEGGMDLAAAMKPDLVICDLHITHGGDGYTLARQLRADPVVKSATIVALTGVMLADEGAQARQAGFDRVLRKPVTLEAIGALLSSIKR